MMKHTHLIEQARAVVESKTWAKQWSDPRGQRLSPHIKRLIDNARAGDWRSGKILKQLVKRYGVRTASAGLSPDQAASLSQDVIKELPSRISDEEDARNAVVNALSAMINRDLPTWKVSGTPFRSRFTGRVSFTHPEITLKGPNPYVRLRIQSDQIDLAVMSEHRNYYALKDGPLMRALSKQLESFGKTKLENYEEFGGVEWISLRLQLPRIANADTKDLRKRAMALFTALQYIDRAMNAADRLKPSMWSKRPIGLLRSLGLSPSAEHVALARLALKGNNPESREARRQLLAISRQN